MERSTRVIAPLSQFRFDLVERFSRIPEGINSRWNAAIHADLKQDFLDLVLGDAVLQRSLDVQLEFVGPAQRPEHRQIDDAAGAAVETRPGPQCAPAEFGRPLRHRPGEFVGAGDRLVDVVFAKHFLADLQSLVEQLAHHWFLPLFEYCVFKACGSAVRPHQARDVRKRIETPDIVDHAVDIPIGSAQPRTIAQFCFDVTVRQRIGKAAFRVHYDLAERLSRNQLDGDARGTIRKRTVKRRPHLLAQGHDVGPKYGCVREFGDAGRAQQQRTGGTMMNADPRVALVANRRSPRASSSAEPCTVMDAISSMRVQLRPQIKASVDHRMKHDARRIRLVGVLRDLPGLAEPAGQAPKIGSSPIARAQPSGPSMARGDAE